MTVIVVKTPRGLFNIFSSDIDGWVAKDLTHEQVVEWYRIAAAEMAQDIVNQLQANQNPFGDSFLSYEDCKAIIKEFNPEGDECPIVNPQYAS